MSENETLNNEVPLSFSSAEQAKLISALQHQGLGESDSLVFDDPQSVRDTNGNEIFSASHLGFARGLLLGAAIPTYSARADLTWKNLVKGKPDSNREFLSYSRSQTIPLDLPPQDIYYPLVYESLAASAETWGSQSSQSLVGVFNIDPLDPTLGLRGLEIVTNNLNSTAFANFRFNIRSGFACKHEVTDIKWQLGSNTLKLNSIPPDGPYRPAEWGPAHMPLQDFTDLTGINLEFGVDNTGTIKLAASTKDWTTHLSTTPNFPRNPYENLRTFVHPDNYRKLTSTNRASLDRL